MTGGLAGALTAAVDALDEVGLRYAIVGGLAAGAWGVNRSTRDADFYAELPSDRRADLRRALDTRAFHVPAMEQELLTFGVFRSRSSDGIFVDIFDAVGPLGDALLAQRRPLQIFDRTVWVIAPDDLFVLKAFSERPRDYEDLVSLARLPRIRLDVAYIERWAKTLDESSGGNEVSERVRRALREAKSKRR